MCVCVCVCSLLISCRESVRVRARASVRCSTFDVRSSSSLLSQFMDRLNDRFCCVPSLSLSLLLFADLRCFDPVVRRHETTATAKTKGVPREAVETKTGPNASDTKAMRRATGKARPRTSLLGTRRSIHNRKQGSIETGVEHFETFFRHGRAREVRGRSNRR